MYVCVCIMYMYVCICICVYVYTHMCICVYLYMCNYICMSIYTCMHVHIEMGRYVHICVYVCITFLLHCKYLPWSAKFDRIITITVYFPCILIFILHSFLIEASIDLEYKIKSLIFLRFYLALKIKSKAFHMPHMH